MNRSTRACVGMNTQYSLNTNSNFVKKELLATLPLWSGMNILKEIPKGFLDGKVSESYIVIINQLFRLSKKRSSILAPCTCCDHKIILVGI